MGCSATAHDRKRASAVLFEPDFVFHEHHLPLVVVHNRAEVLAASFCISSRSVPPGTIV
jgi:hypothetical protein